MDVRYINPFLLGTVEVLQKFSNVKAVPKKPFLKKSDVAFGDISGIIGLTGDVMGSLAICFREDCILGILSNMFGEIHSDVTHETYDAVGEITNMISGNARSRLEKEGLTVFAAIPSVVTGVRHSINHILQTPSIVIPFSTAFGNLVVDVCLRSVDQDERKKENYQVVNVSTEKYFKSSPRDLTSVPSIPPKDGAIPENDPLSDKKKNKSETPKFDHDDYQGKLEYSKANLIKAVALRDRLFQQLNDQPFMERSKRQRISKEVAFLDGKIKNLKLSITALETLIRSQSGEEEPVNIPSHYQNYDKKTP